MAVARSVQTARNRAHLAMLAHEREKIGVALDV